MWDHTMTDNHDHVIMTQTMIMTTMMMTMMMIEMMIHVDLCVVLDAHV